ncbi:MAG: NAD(P)/FAD-dependent oxidoreductase [Bacteroidia bacterium]|nr:NAD(P)/FAD-dependent oxidoreductase [Bacteroidia bacterium]MCX7763397.1 NAD(P)/FAD-dependent oxidoreductase [Bacteroidia bacterium]MDW8057256.1 NAD(P)/FAD-dependent oxidoreductase [Bacteroidia bacterium]
MQYDLIILGGGAAGFAGAMRAMDFHRRVLLIEKNQIGGAALSSGALSSKTWWELAKDFDKLFLTDRGYKVKDFEFSFAEFRRIVQQAVEERRAQMLRQINHYQNLGLLKLVYGTAEFIDPHRIRVFPREGEPFEAEADYFLLATGSRPRLLPDFPVDGRRVITSDHIDLLEEFPPDLLIIGSGVIGCEFATIFSTFPGVRVTMIEKADRILPYEDPDISEVVMQNLSECNVRFFTNAQLKELRRLDDTIEYVVEKDGKLYTEIASHALIAIGREPNSKELGLERIGVRMEPSGHIFTHNTQTSVSHIYAAGDLDNQKAGFVNVAEQEARYAVERMFGRVKRPLEYDHLSWIMFLRPEVAGIGLNESGARAQGYAYRAVRYNYDLTARGIAMRTRRSFFKLITTDEPDPYILGCRAVGPQASSIIGLVAMMIRFSKRVSDLCTVLQPHPSLTEGIQECAREILNEAIFKPEFHM